MTTTPAHPRSDGMRFSPQNTCTGLAVRPYNHPSAMYMSFHLSRYMSFLVRVYMSFRHCIFPSFCSCLCPRPFAYASFHPSVYGATSARVSILPLVRVCGHVRPSVRVLPLVRVWGHVRPSV